MVEPNANPDDAAIAEFHGAARRRNVRIFAIASLLCVAIGIVIVIVAFTAGATIDDSSRVELTRHVERRAEIRVVFAGIAFIVAGGGLGWNAWRVRRGEIV